MQPSRKVSISIHGTYACTSFYEFRRLNDRRLVKPIQMGMAEALLRKSPELYVRIDFQITLTNRGLGTFRPIGLPKISLNEQEGIYKIEAQILGTITSDAGEDKEIAETIAKLKSPITFIVNYQANRYHFECIRDNRIQVETLVDSSNSRSSKQLSNESMLPDVASSKDNRAELALTVAELSPNEPRVSPNTQEHLVRSQEESVTKEIENSCVLLIYEVNLLADSWSYRYFAQRFGIEKGKLVWNDFKSFLDGNEYYYDLVKFKANVANTVARFTYKWSGNTHVLPLSRVSRFDNQRDFLIREMERYKKNFVDIYESSIRRFLNTGYALDPDSFPSLATIREEIRIYISYFPVPTTTFPNQLSESQRFILEEVRNTEFSRFIERVFEDFKSDLNETLRKVIASIQEVEGQTRKPKIYETTVNRLIELADLENELNFRSCSRTAKGCEVIRRAFTMVDAAKLRTQPMLRADIRRHLNQAVAHLSHT